MILETIGLFFCTAVLTLIGLGPAVWLVQGNRRILYALGIAPTLGLVIAALLGFPLVRFVGPARVWAWPAAILLILTSLALAASHYRRHPAASSSLLTPHVSRFTHHASRITLLAPRSSLLLTSLFLLLASLLLVSPMRQGIQYTVFRSNPSDAFLYMSLAQTFRTVDWQTITAGAPLTADNLEQVSQLAAESPTSLLAARHVTWPLPLNKMVLFAWLAELARATTPDFYFAHHLLSFIVILPLSLVIGDTLRLPSWLNLLSAAAISLGFWARFVLETDAGYEITVLPALMLFVFAWIQLESETTPRRFPAHLLLALSAAAIATLYVPLAAVVVVAFAGYYLLALLQRLRPLQTLLWHGLTLALLLAILTLSGQIDFTVRSTRSIQSRTANEANFSTPTFNVVKNNGLAGLWGLPPSYLPDSLPAKIAVPFGYVAVGAGLLLSAALVLAGLSVIPRQTPPAERIILSLVAAGALLALFFFLADNRRIAGKMISYVYPYLIFGPLLFTHYLDTWRIRRAQKIALAFLGGWLVAQCLFGLYLSNRASVDFITNRPRPERYDLGPITNYLGQNDPHLLLVNIPRQDTWMFAYYAMFAFGRYPAYFQSGLVMDNKTDVQNLWLATMPAAPDYAVTLKTTDYLGPAGLGTKVAETRDLVLYRITAGDATAFITQEEQYRQAESLKPIFPGLEP